MIPRGLVAHRLRITSLQGSPYHKITVFFLTSFVSSTSLITLQSKFHVLFAGVLPLKDDGPFSICPIPDKAGSGTTHVLHLYQPVPEEQE